MDLFLLTYMVIFNCSLSEQMNSEEKYFHFLDNVLAPVAVTLMFAWWMWTIGST
jgi:hypothetical protein